jgi:hypothetical protein
MLSAGSPATPCRCPIEKTLFLPVRNVTARSSPLDQVSFPVRLRRLLSRPGLPPAGPRRAAEGMGGAEPPAATRSAHFGASMARTASTGPSPKRAPWHARLRPEKQAAAVRIVRVQPLPRALPLLRLRLGAMAAPLSAGPALPSCSVAAAAPGDSDAGAARNCPAAA